MDLYNIHIIRHTHIDIWLILGAEGIRILSRLQFADVMHAIATHPLGRCGIQDIELDSCGDENKKRTEVVKGNERNVLVVMRRLQPSHKISCLPGWVYAIAWVSPVAATLSGITWFRCLTSATTAVLVSSSISLSPEGTSTCWNSLSRRSQYGSSCCGAAW